MTSTTRGWLIVLAGICINLSFGVLYAWSVFAGNLRDVYGWTSTQSSLPYTVAIVMFTLLMVFGGRLQDKIGPRVAVTIAGFLVGSGLIISSYFPTVAGLTFGFGILCGSGFGVGYSATTPVAVKWFPPHKKGLVSGLVVSGFGLAALYIAPLTRYLISTVGIYGAFRTLGIAFLIVIVTLAQTLRNPDKPIASVPASPDAAAAPAPAGRDYTWQEMIKTTQFYQLWLMFAAGSLAGLMIIGHLATIANDQSGLTIGFTIVSLAAISNSLGRPVAGFISDKIGRGRTMMVLCLLQGIALLFFSSFTTFATILLGAATVTFGFGAMLSVYPSAVADFYGTKNLGSNYGVLFTAWGVGGVIGPILAGFILDATGGYQLAFLTSAALLFVAAFIGFIMKPVTHAPPKVA